MAASLRRRGVRSPDGTLVKVLAPAWRWQIVEQTFDGRTAQTLMLARLEQPLPASWEE